jgi:hypothetical protein
MAQNKIKKKASLEKILSGATKTIYKKNNNHKIEDINGQ